MLVKKVLVYIILLGAIFFSLFFIAGQNKDYQEIRRLETKLNKQIEMELISYKENLYKIEKMKSELGQTSSKQKLEIGTIYLDKQQEDIQDIQKQIEKL